MCSIEVANMVIIYWSDRSFSKREGDGVNWVDGEKLFLPANSFTLLEYMIVCCKVQVIINPLPLIAYFLYVKTLSAVIILR